MSRPLPGRLAALTFHGLLLSVGCLIHPQALAQVPAATPPTGRVEADTRQPPQPLPRDSIRIAAPRFAEQVPAGAEALRFTLDAVVITGYSRLPTAGLQTLWSDRVGQRITLAQAFGIAASVSAYYRQAGYLLSQAIVPAQDLPTDRPATLRIQVLEGHLDEVRVTGLAEAPVRALLAPALAEKPLTLSTLERQLLLLAEQPGVRSQANLSAGTTPQGTRLELLAQQKRFSGSVNVHNRTAPSQGDVRLEASVEGRGLLGTFDRHSLRWAGSGDPRLSLMGYSGDAPLGADGLRLQWSASVTRSQPESTVTNIDNDSSNVSLGLGYAAVRSRRANVTLRGSFNGYDNAAETTAGPVSRDRIRAVRLGFTGDLADTLGGITLLDLEWSRGLNGLGSSSPDDPLLLGAKPAFNKGVLYAARLQSLGGGASLLLAHTQQASSDKLPTAEQLGLGGDVFLRAYDPSEAIGEKGHASKLELRWDSGPLGARLPVALTLYGYYDAGQVQRRQTGAAVLKTTLKAAGAGLRFTAPMGLRGYVEWAQPIDRPVVSQGNDKARVFAGLGIDF